MIYTMLMSRVLNIAENFAEFFDKKVSDIVNATVINPRVYMVARKFTQIMKCS